MVVVYGTICLDRVRQVDALPPKGGYSEIRNESLFVGGEASNTAIALRKWGAEARLCGNSIGTGAESKRLADLLAESGFGDSDWRTGAFDAPFCDIYVTPDGERTMFGRGFAEMAERTDASVIEFVPESWLTADSNHGRLARNILMGAYEQAMKTYALDFVEAGDQIPTGSFWQSSTDWVGERGNTQRNVRWLQSWVERHECFGILSDGPNGFAAGSPEMRVRAYPPYPCPELVDSTGAGDCFRAGMLFGLDGGWDLAQCLRFASAAACLNCSSLGATAGLPSRESILELVASRPEVSGQYA